MKSKKIYWFENEDDLRYIVARLLNLLKDFNLNQIDIEFDINNIVIGQDKFENNFI